MLSAPVVRAQAPGSPPTSAGPRAATQPKTVTPRGPTATTSPDSEVVWLRKRVEQLEAQLASGMRCPGTSGMGQGMQTQPVEPGQPTMHGRSMMQGQQPVPEPPAPGALPPPVPPQQAPTPSPLPSPSGTPPADER
jgi:hypothetical protein